MKGKAESACPLKSDATAFKGDVQQHSKDEDDSDPFVTRKVVPASSFYEGGELNKRDRQGIRARMLAARGKKIITRLRAAVARYRSEAVFREFPLQKDAFAYADSVAAGQAEDVRVFARELDTTGKRRFFATTYEECWQRLTRTENNCQHFYEVIREGLPCYLYFDIEYSKELNPTTDGQRAMAAFLEFLPRGLRKLYPEHKFEFRPGDIIDLDSSSDTKFSRHLIVRPNSAQVVFKDNIHMGACVRRLLQVIREEMKGGGSAELAHIFVRTSPSQEGFSYPMDRSADQSQPFVDTGVYTKNRCFRTFHSSKYGKKVVLKNANGCEDTYELHGNDEVLFYKSLVCRLAHPLHFLTLLLDPCLRTPLETCKFGETGATRTVPPPVHQGGRETCGDSRQWEGQVPLAIEEERAWRNVAEHVISVWNARAGGALGRIRSVTWQTPRIGSESAAAGRVSGGGNTRGRVASLQVDGNRWCDRIGRQHKSNGIILIVDSGKGCFYQKCFDPDCRAARATSNEFPLPARLVCSLSQAAAHAACDHRSVRSASVESHAMTPAVGHVEEEWSDEILAGIDEILRQKGLAENEADAEWSDDLLASIDDFLQLRGLAEGHKCERVAMPNSIDETCEACEVWDDELLDSIDEMIRCRQCSSLLAQEGSVSTPQSHQDVVGVSTQSSTVTIAHAEPASVSSFSDMDFDDACIRAAEEAEREFVGRWGFCNQT